MRLDSIEDVFEHCVPEPNTGCWLWAHCLNPDGYGKYLPPRERSPRSVHRRALELVGIDVEGKHACHKCDTRACCNPEHLFVGTSGDNVRDAMRKGRHRVNTISGTAHYQAKLNPDSVRAIRALRKAGWQQKQIAKVFGVSRSAVLGVLRGTSWRAVS